MPRLGDAAHGAAPSGPGWLVSDISRHAALWRLGPSRTYPSPASSPLMGPSRTVNLEEEPLFPDSPVFAASGHQTATATAAEAGNRLLRLLLLLPV